MNRIKRRSYLYRKYCPILALMLGPRLRKWCVWLVFATIECAHTSSHIAFFSLFDEILRLFLSENYGRNTSITQRSVCVAVDCTHTSSHIAFFSLLGKIKFVIHFAKLANPSQNSNYRANFEIPRTMHIPCIRQGLVHTCIFTNRFLSLSCAMKFGISFAQAAACAKRYVPPLLIENWLLSKLYFYSDERIYARLILVLLIIMELISIGLNVLFSYWHNAFFSALQQMDQSVFGRLLSYFSIIILAIAVVTVSKSYLAQLLELRWRHWLTNHLLNNYLAEHAYYGASFKKNRDDNPDQKISADVGSYISHTCNLTTGALRAFTSFISHVFILWSLSGVTKIQVTQHFSYNMRGSLLWVAITWAGLGERIFCLVFRRIKTTTILMWKRERIFRTTEKFLATEIPLIDFFLQRQCLIHTLKVF